MREYLARSRARRALLSLLDPQAEDPTADSGGRPAAAPKGPADLP